MRREVVLLRLPALLYPLPPLPSVLILSLPSAAAPAPLAALRPFDGMESDQPPQPSATKPAHLATPARCTRGAIKHPPSAECGSFRLPVWACAGEAAGSGEKEEVDIRLLSKSLTHIH